MPNLIANPRKWEKKAVLLKGETGYAVDAAPTGLLNWVEARNVSLTSFDAETAERNIEMPYMGNGGKVITSIWSKLSFEVALAGSAAPGTAPKLGPILLGGGFAETISAGVSTTYNLISDAFGSMTAYLNIDGTLYKFVGARTEIKGKITAKGTPMLTVDMSSLYTTPVEGAMPTISRTGWLLEEAVNSVNTGKLTLNGIDLAFSSLEWGCGNNLARIDLPGPQREVAIDGRKPTASTTVLAPALSVFNPYTLAESGAVVDITNTHGSAAGKKTKIDLKAKIIGVAEDKIEKMLAYKLTLEPFPDDGNDEIVLTFL